MFLVASKLTPLIGVESDGVRYVLSSRESNGVAFPTFLHGGFGEETIEAALTALATHAGVAGVDGFTVLEIGANIGTETVSFLVRHGAKRVVAIEPGAENVRFLRANLALNDLQDRATIHQIALSDSDGEVTLEHSEENWGDHRVRRAGEATDLDGTRRATSTVNSRRLDSLIEAGELEIEEIGLVWMDTQGHEGHVLAGAERLLRAGVPVVTEYWPHALAEAGTLESVNGLIRRHYKTIVDLGDPRAAIAAERIPDVADDVRAGRRGVQGVAERDRYTDLLLLAG